MSPQLVLDRYRIIDQAGSGGFATVYAAWDTRLQRKVAIKEVQLSDQDISLVTNRPENMGGHTTEAAQPTVVIPHPEDIPPWEEDPTQGLETLVYPEDPAFIQNKPPFDPYTPVSIKLGTADQRRFFSHIPGLDEARAAAHLEDPNIVHVHDFQIMENQAYIIMEYLDGVSLTEFLDSFDDQLTMNIIASLFSDIAHALEVAHENQVLHLDIKPDNIIVTRKGTVKVTDFGMAALSDHEGNAYTYGGTIGYMPLEQMRQESLDCRCDEWALASVTYQMLTGENPFLASTLPQAEQAILNAKLKLPSPMWNDLDPEADDVLFYALDPDKSERYASVMDFAEELLPLLGDPRAGRREIAQLMGSSVREEAAHEEPLSVPAIPWQDLLTPKTKSVLARVAGAAGTGAFALLSLGNIPYLTQISPWLPAVIALVLAALGAFRPALGAFCAGLTWSTALLLSQQWILGAAMALATLLWAAATRKATTAAGNIALAQPWAVPLGIPFVGPMLAGFFLPVGQAAISSLYAIVTAFTIASAGGGTLLGCAFSPLTQLSAGTVYPQGVALANLQSLSTYAIAGSWLLASVAFSALCSRGKTLPACLGAVFATVILIAGMCLGTWLSTGGASMAPPALSTTLTVLAGGVFAVLARIAVPSRHLAFP